MMQQPCKSQLGVTKPEAKTPPHHPHPLSILFLHKDSWKGTNISIEEPQLTGLNDPGVNMKINTQKTTASSL